MTLVGGGGPDGQGPDGPPQSSHYLHPGHVFVSVDPATVLTILGSCAAVCLWDIRRGAGGMNHFLLPHRVGGDLASPRYGNVAVVRLVQGLLDLGSNPEDLRAKLFGGAAVLPRARERRRSLGAQNAAVARELLEERKIPVVAEDVGGTRGRRVIFSTSDGAVWLKRL